MYLQIENNQVQDVQHTKHQWLCGIQQERTEENMEKEETKEKDEEEHEECEYY